MLCGNHIYIVRRQPRKVLTMLIKCQVINMPRPVLCILTAGILCFCLEGRTSGEPITEGRALSNGLIAFADAPDRRPGPQANQYAQIYTITPDGGNRKQLTTGKPGNFFPAWCHQVENSWHLFLYEIKSMKSGL